MYSRINFLVKRSILGGWLHQEFVRPAVATAYVVRPAVATAYVVRPVVATAYVVRPVVATAYVVQNNQFHF